MDNKPSKQTKQRKSEDQPIVNLSDIMRSGLVYFDRLERNKVYYNARFKHLGNSVGFQFPINIEDKDEKFVFLSIEKTIVFRDEIRYALDYKLVKQIF